MRHNWVEYKNNIISNFGKNILIEGFRCTNCNLYALSYTQLDFYYFSYVDVDSVESFISLTLLEKDYIFDSCNNILLRKFIE